jgi:tripartite ATP-independent transporter DctP family solute receptor
VLFLAFTMLAAFPAGAAEFVLRVGHNGGIDHPYQNGLAFFKRIVEEKSGGRIEVVLFPSGQLGPEDRVSNMVRTGLIAAQFASVAGGFSPYVPDADVLNYPFLFKSLGQYYAVVDGPVGAQLAGEIENRLDVVFLGWGFSGIRNLWNRKHPVSTPADLKNLKLRVINSKIVIDTFGAFNAEVTPMAFGEVYNALLQGVIDGAETDNVDLMTERFYETTKYVSQTNHLYLGAGLVFSKKIFDRLPPEFQRIVKEAGAAAVAEERRGMAEASIQARIFLIEKGIKFNDVDQAKFIEAAAPVYSHIASPSISALIRRIQAQ